MEKKVPYKIRFLEIRLIFHFHERVKYPSRELAYPTHRRGKSPFQLPLRGILFLEGISKYFKHLFQPASTTCKTHDNNPPGPTRPIKPAVMFESGNCLGQYVTARPQKSLRMFDTENLLTRKLGTQTWRFGSDDVPFATG